MKRITAAASAPLLAAAMLLGACDSTPQAALPTPIQPASAPSVATAPQPTPAIEQVVSAAPGTPIAQDNWVPGARHGVGTAFTYDQPPGKGNPSRVWFGITDGAITDGLYPDITLANLKSLALLVTDGRSFIANETTDATHRVERLDGRTPAFRVISTDRQGRWAAVKEIVTDPQANTILFTVTFQALVGTPADYRLYLVYTPRIGNSGAGDLSRAQAGMAEAWDEQAGIATALLSDPAPAFVTTGYSGQSDIFAALADYTADEVATATTIPGRLTMALELLTGSTSTVALGFGARREDARAAAAASLQRGFPAVSQAYMQGWARYLDTLVHPYPNLPLYDESAAVIKTHTDKTFYGAGIASISLPWGQWRDDTDPRERGYRYVWPRDLYHIAMAMLVMGDEQGAHDALAYLDDVLQQTDGSFPQNAFLDGTPRGGHLQLDEVADPIILAWQLKAVDRYASLVKPAADVILAIGPKTPQERWEENGGYSPATLAAEIAGLVCAADLARQAGDIASAERYLKLADDWNASIEHWTLTTNGPLGKGSYYLRISNGDPNSTYPVLIANGGPTVDQREVVDQSFLELVRLGLRAPDDPRIVATLEVTDATLEVKTPKGEVYRRYPQDRYGEPAPGQAPPGQGHGWPLLLGEHSLYEIALTRSEHPASWYLPVMSSFANQGGMLPEQVFPDGAGTGSATPLAWAHAEYIIFANAVKQGAVPDMPAVVAERYLN